MPAPGFTYVPYDALGIWVSTFASRYRHFLAFERPHEARALGVVIPDGTSGSFAVDGIGFQPDALLVFSSGMNFDVGAVDDMALGLGCAVSNGSLITRWTCGQESEFGDIGKRRAYHLDDALMHLRGDNARWEVDISSFDADGFTLDVVTAPDQDVRLMGLALRYPSTPQFAAGTELSPTTDGTQSISGLGFEPTAVLLSTTNAEVLDADHSWARMCVGTAEPTNGQWWCWTGARADDFYVDMGVDSGACLAMLIDAEGAGPFVPTLVSLATMDSFDADGFTLDWSDTDGTQRYYSWLAVAADVETNRFVYNAGNGQQTVATRKDPRGIFSFQNQVTLEFPYSNHNTQSFGHGMGLGMCDDSLYQGVFDSGLNDAHTFPLADLASRYGNIESAFGATEQSNGDFLAPGPQDHATIIRMAQRKPQIYRRHPVGIGSPRGL